MRDSKPPDVDPERPFETPWQARAFGLAVAFADEHDLEWSAFQSRLAERIETRPDGYYESWLAATEELLVEAGAVDPGEFEARAAAFAAGNRDASEFVEGWDGDGGHDHDHTHDHDH
jgi:nitrile hydratase accessory protein